MALRALFIEPLSGRTIDPTALGQTATDVLLIAYRLKMNRVTAQSVLTQMIQHFISADWPYPSLVEPSVSLYIYR
jgi:hypothetical protein